MNRFEGGCHCGAIGVTLFSDKRATALPIRQCQCSFCRKHGVRTTSDPDGRVEIRVRAPDHLQRYRFGLGTADFLLCRNCGVYLAAVMTEGDQTYAIVEVDALDKRADFTQAPAPMDYDAEDEAARRARRRERWTPAVFVT